MKLPNVIYMYQFRVHRECDKLYLTDYNYLQGSTILGFVYHVAVQIIPFGNLRAKDFSSPILKTLKSPLKTILSPEQNIENVVNSRYLYIDQIQSLSFSKKERSLFFVHINACSLNKNFDDLVYLLKCTSKSFDIILVKLEYLRNLNSYSFEVTPTESAACGIIFDVSFRIAVLKLYPLATLCWVNLDANM